MSDPVEHPPICEAGVAQDVRAAIEAGIADSMAGRTISVEDLRVRFGLEP